ncbi:unnamed protein product [Knipowitschia caucasica]|uniref:Sarcospan n=1 Tax=Knipowitschia caucasica TaxID=637954 RepID=A0AAV2L677_KNICA
MREESPEPERRGGRRLCRFPLILALLQLLLGVAVTVVAFLQLSLTPSLTTRETPHWAGITMCAVAVLGLVLFCVTSRPDERSFLQFMMKILFFFFCSVGLIVSVLAAAFSGHHYSQSSSFTCERLGPECICTWEPQDPQDPLARRLRFLEVEDCASLTETLPLMQLLQLLLNVLQALLCAAAAFLMWRSRYQGFFSGTQGSSWSKV